MITLGKEVKDRVSGFKGIATAKCEYLNGCVQILVHPKVDEKGEMKKGSWIDESQLEEIGPGVWTETMDTGGGFREHPDD